MSYYIIHLTTPNCSLSVEKGILFCKFSDDDIRKISIDDIRAIIIATNGINFTNNCRYA